MDCIISLFVMALNIFGEKNLGGKKNMRKGITTLKVGFSIFKRKKKY